MLHTSRLLSYAHLIQAAQARRGLLEPQARQLGLNSEEAERVLETLHTLSVADGCQLVGRKMIPVSPQEPNVQSGLPTLGYLYEHSLAHAEDNAACIKLRSVKQVHVEPKLVFSLGSTPEQGDSLETFLQRFDSVALALEFLQNPFKGEAWTDEDKVCANGFHSKLLIGEARTMSHKSRTVFDQLVSHSSMTLNVIDQQGSHIVGFGVGRDNVDKSLQQAYALHQRHIESKEESPFAKGQYLAMGGWLPSKQIAAGQEWVVVVSGVELPSLRVAIA
jgi:2-keto-4-pentenoate hydratase